MQKQMTKFADSTVECCTTCAKCSGGTYFLQTSSLKWHKTLSAKLSSTTLPNKDAATFVSISKLESQSCLPSISMLVLSDHPVWDSENVRRSATSSGKQARRESSFKAKRPISNRLTTDDFPCRQCSTTSSLMVPLIIPFLNTLSENNGLENSANHSPSMRETGFYGGEKHVVILKVS